MNQVRLIGPLDSFSLLIVRKRRISVQKYLQFHLIGMDFARMSNFLAFDCVFSVICVSSLAVAVSDCRPSSVRCMVNNELSMSWIEVVVAYFSVLCGHFTFRD